MTEVVLRVDDGRAVDAVVAEWDETATIHALGDALARHMGGGLVEQSPGWELARTSSVLDPDLTVAEAGLRSGDTLIARNGRKAQPSGGSTSGVAVEIVDGGPPRRVHLPAGIHNVGRDPARAGVVLDDSAVSGVHVELLVASDGRVTVRDLGSRNGTSVAGRRLTEPTSVPAGTVIEIGRATLTIPAIATADSNAEGRVRFNRPPNPRTPETPQVVHLPPLPEKPDGRRLPIATSLVPLVLGLGLYFATGRNVSMLAFAAMSPVMAVASYVTDRRSGRGDYDAKVRAFDEEMAKLAETTARAHDAVIARRRADDPGVAEVRRWIAGTTTDLWSRRPGADDFLRVRLGVADRATKLEFKREGEGSRRPTAAQEATVDPAMVLRSRHDVDPSVPAAAELAVGPVGIAGSSADALDAARAIILEIAALHSPRDVALVGIIAEEHRSDWELLRWLPHTETLNAGSVADRTVAATNTDAKALLQQVADLVAERSSNTRIGSSSTPSPAVVVLIGQGVDIARPVLAEVLSKGPAVGVTAVVVADTTALLPGECAEILDITPAGGAHQKIISTGVQVSEITPERIGATSAAELALALCPLRDVSASRGGDIPNEVNLLDALGLEPPTAEAIVARWSRSRKSLDALVGVGGGGEVRLDFRVNYHAVVAGTTGAGKSELLQAWVASLAASHPPSRLTFVFVDFKGGAAFGSCADLPHTVGYVTNLDGSLADRARVSLEAELRRRERIITVEGGHPDLATMEDMDREHAPPSLVIVFDEFAKLKADVPQFMDGVIDIAARGRSLGVHLVLATQKPMGVVDDKIRANADLRIALRVADDQDSTDMLGVTDAVRISKSTPGRGLVQTSRSETQLVQSAYVGARRTARVDAPTVSVRPFGFGADSGPVRASAPKEGPRDLDRLVDAIVDAARLIDSPPIHRPWVTPLSDLYPLEALPTADPATSEGLVRTIIGMADEPDEQRLNPLVLDLSSWGNVAIYGTSGSGKTTALRTIAAALATGLSPADLHIYAVDSASRALGGIAMLPHCAAVIDGDDAERVERLFTSLEAELEARRALLASSGASSISELRSTGRTAPPAIVLMIDGIGPFRDRYEEVDHGAMNDRLQALASAGRAAAIHIILTADQHRALPYSLEQLVVGRVVLRMASADEYTMLDVADAARGAVLPPGRALIEGRQVQIAVAGSGADGASQVEALSWIADRWPDKVGRPSPVEVLGDVVQRSLLPPATTSRTVAIGLDAARLEPVFVRLGDAPTFLVAGPSGSGRTSTLVALSAALMEADPLLEAYGFAPRPSSTLRDAVAWTGFARGVAQCEELAVRLADQVMDRDEDATTGLLLVVDDADGLAEGTFSSNLQTILRRGRDCGVIVLAAGAPHAIRAAYGSWLRDMANEKHGLLLNPDVTTDGDLLGITLPRSPVRSPPGRGFLAYRQTATLLHVAT